jgi:hypothetical protein
MLSVTFTREDDFILVIEKQNFKRRSYAGNLAASQLSTFYPSGYNSKANIV